MILIDTSAWIDFLRDEPGSLTDVVDAALDSEAAICDAISMEVLAGARDERLRRGSADGIELRFVAQGVDKHL